jgi:hypothetical protein
MGFCTEAGRAHYHRREWPCSHVQHFATFLLRCLGKLCGHYRYLTRGRRQVKPRIHTSESPTMQARHSRRISLLRLTPP